MRLVVDASVAVKWFLNEVWTAESFRLLEPPFELLAPEHLIAEMANVVWKYQQRREITTAEAAKRAQFISQVNVRLAPSADLVEGAMEIACDHSIAVYDALYVQLAVAESVPLVTVDDQLLRKLENSVIRSHLVHIRDLSLPA